ncbi:MAG TPA: OmpA family protein [Spirochaetota bacterium]|nr:OmpA family protein [Spirochaetota bacterium]
MGKKYLLFFVLSVTVTLFLFGCVSTQKYNDLEMKNKKTEQGLDSLERANEQQKNKIVDLESEIEKADMEIADLRKMSDELRVMSEKEVETLKRTYDSLEKNLKDEISQGKIQIEQTKGKLTMKVAEELFFDTGKAEIKPDGKSVLLRIGNILKKIPEKNIRIEGHTDNVQIVSTLRLKYPTNWELGSARATTVVRFLQDEVGIDPLRLSAVSYGEYRPVATNRTERGRAKNRRIEIILIDRDLDLAKKMRENLK